MLTFHIGVKVVHIYLTSRDVILFDFLSLFYYLLLRKQYHARVFEIQTKT